MKLKKLTIIALEMQKLKKEKESLVISTHIDKM